MLDRRTRSLHGEQQRDGGRNGGFVERKASAGRSTGAGRSPSARSERTRNALIDAARRVFNRSGFHDAKIGEIAEAAGVAHGSFYTHFESKEAVFLEVLLQVHRETLQTARGKSERSESVSPLERIDMTNRRYMDTYRRNARILASFEHLADTNERFADLRRRTRMDYIRRTEAAIEHWQRDGLVEPDLDITCTAHALGGMVERFAYMTYAYGEGCADETRALAALNHIWGATLGLLPAAPAIPTEE
jgi:AcrR family transcriptional regulator